MRSPSRKPGGLTGTTARWLSATAAATLTCCLLAALPTASASAAPPSITAVEAAQVRALLDQVGLGTLGTEELVEALEGLPQLEGINPSVLKEALTGTIEALIAEGADLGELLESPASVAQLEESLKQALGPLSGLLETLLGGNPASKLTEALGSLSSGEVVGSILASSGEPEKVIAEALGSVPGSQLQEAIGSLPTGEPFSKGTVEELAGQAGVTPQALAEELGASSEELPPTAMALTGALANGTKLGVVKTVSGLGMALLGSAEELEGGGGKEGGGGSSGGTGGSAGSGGSGGSGGNTTIVVQAPGASRSPAGAAVSAARRIRILSHHVHGHTLTVVVATPSAGIVSLTGKGVRPTHRRAVGTGTLTLRTTLTRAAASALRKHRRSRLQLAVRVAFKPTTGPSSSTSTRTVFR